MTAVPTPVVMFCSWCRRVMVGPADSVPGPGQTHGCCAPCQIRLEAHS